MPADLLVLSRYGPLGASSRVRIYQYLEHLRAAGIDADVHPLFDDAYVAARNSGSTMPSIAQIARAYLRRLWTLLTTNDARALWIEYEVLPWLPFGFERWLYLARRPVIVDYDDAIFHRYDTHPRPTVRRILGAKIDRVMAAATLVIAGNDYLATRARTAGARQIEILPSVIDLERYRQEADFASDGLVIGWIGSRSTAPYLQMIATVLRDLSARLPVRLVNVSGAPLNMPGVDVRNVPWSEGSEIEEMLRFDVGVMPLPDEPWTRGKCGFKLIQYMGCALPTVASPVGMNAAIVDHGQTGYLASTPDEWRAALESLAASARLRQAMGQAGYAKVQSQYSLAVTAPRLVGLVQSALQETRR